MSPERKRPSRQSKAAAAKAAPPRPFTAHLMVPPHELLSEAESAETVTKLGVSIERLPKILLSDPGLKTDPKLTAAREAREPLVGRLVRIRRPSATAGEAVAYRVIVAGLEE